MKLLASVLKLLKAADVELSKVKNVESIEEYEGLIQIYQAMCELSGTEDTITKATKNLNRHLAELASRKVKGQCKGNSWWGGGASAGHDDRECLRQFKKFVARQGWLCTGGFQFIKVEPVKKQKSAKGPS